MKRSMNLALAAAIVSMASRTADVVIPVNALGRPSSDIIGAEAEPFEPRTRATFSDSAEIFGVADAQIRARTDGVVAWP